MGHHLLQLHSSDSPLSDIDSNYTKLQNQLLRRSWFYGLVLLHPWLLLLYNLSSNSQSQHTRNHHDRYRANISKNLLLPHLTTSSLHGGHSAVLNHGGHSIWRDGTQLRFTGLIIITEVVLY